LGLQLGGKFRVGVEGRVSLLLLAGGLDGRGHFYLALGIVGGDGAAVGLALGRLVVGIGKGGGRGDYNILGRSGDGIESSLNKSLDRLL